MRLDRLLSIIIMLLNRDRVQAKELAEHFDVSIRTVYRDIDAINMAGIPIVSFQGNQGGLGIIDNYKLDRQLLTLNDMVAILSVLKGINTSFQDQQLNTAIEKIHSLVPDEKHDHVKNHLDQMIIDVMPWGISTGQKEKMQQLQQAIANCRMVSFLYRDSKGIKTTRSVEPMTLIFKATAWYLFAYCTKRNDFRLFRLTRMTRLAMKSKLFIRRVIDYRQYDRRYPGKAKTVKLEVRFSRQIRHRIEDYFDESYLTYEKDGSITARFELPDDEWVVSYLLSYGEQAELLKPKKLREILKQRVDRIAGLYRTGK